MDYYGILDVNKNASVSDIKKAFHKKALKLHPDKNEDKEWAGEEFKKIKKAYEVLSNSEKRQMYDLYGDEGVVEEDNYESMDLNSMFDAVFKSFPINGMGSSCGSASFIFDSFPHDIMGTVFGDISPEKMNIFGNLGNLSSMGDIAVFMKQFDNLKNGGSRRDNINNDKEENDVDKTDNNLGKPKNRKIVEEFEIELPMSIVYKGKMTKIQYGDGIIEIPSWKKRWETNEGNYTFNVVRDGKSFERMGDILIVHKKVSINNLLTGKDEISIVFPNNDKIRIKTGWDIALENGKEMKMRIIIPERGFWNDERTERADAHVIISISVDKKNDIENIKDKEKSQNKNR